MMVSYYGGGGLFLLLLLDFLLIYDLWKVVFMCLRLLNVLFVLSSRATFLSIRGNYL